jgi:uncharacterized protein (TIGR04552 family)
MDTLKRIGDFSLADLDSVWLILRGGSVVDWHRLNMPNADDGFRFLRSHGMQPDDPRDRDHIERIQRSAIDYLRRQFDFPIPRPFERATVEQLLIKASGKGHRQLCACTILKAMHIIHHVESRELLFSLAMSNQDLFRLVEERVYRVVGHMLSSGLPITEFVGGRKHRDSIYTKLLSKSDAHASAIYDKLRFRIVTRTLDDILPILRYLSEHLFPFNYVAPEQSINTLLPFRSYCADDPNLKALCAKLQVPPGDAMNIGDNLFSSESYSIIHFVVDLPVRVADDVLNAAPAHVRQLGNIVFGLCEFQMLDQTTEENNETGDASHDRYKGRQLDAVSQRLKLGKRRGN